MLSHQTVIIVAVCASVGGLVFTFLIARLYRRARASPKTSPLPPIQPLAHHREQMLAKLEASSSFRSAKWYGPGPLSAPHSFAFPSPDGSNVSLLGNESPASVPSNSRHPSADPAGTAPSPLHPVPNISSASHSSINSTNHDIQFPAFSRSRSTANLSLNSKSQSESHSPRRPRRLSGSSSHTGLSRSSRNINTSRSNIRGVPHAPYSQVQIILPAPLALGTMPGQQSVSKIAKQPETDAFGRMSMVDRWVPSTVRSTSMLGSETLGGPEQLSPSSSGYLSNSHPLSIL